MATPNTSTSFSTALPVHYSQAQDWRALRAFVQDALADAQHHSAALKGARPEFRLVLSRRHLPMHLWPQAEVQRQLEKISAELRRQGVVHAIHWVVAGNSEPAQHELHISLQR